MSTVGSPYVDRWRCAAHESTPRGRDLGLSLAVTAALFTTAFAAMTSFRAVSVSRDVRSDEHIMFVPIDLPAPAPAARTVPLRRDARPSAQPTDLARHTH